MRKVILIAAISLLVVLVAGYAAATTVTPAPDQGQVVSLARAAVQEATPTPQFQPEAEGALPALVVAASPAAGEIQPVNEPVEISFDRAMDRDSVERAFAIEPGASVDGTFDWPDDRTVRFMPNDGFERGQRYRVRITETARSQDGQPLARPFELRFSTVGFLEVTNVQPAPGSGEVDPATSVTVMFNRPVVALEALGRAAGQPDPLTFVPPVRGQGEWLNTATYRFTPAEGFEPATEYTGRISRDLTDVFGQSILPEDFEWSFTTVSPAVVASSPAPGNLYVSPTPVISVAFNQAMDRASVERNLELVETVSGNTIPGRFSWSETGIVPPGPSPDEQFLYDPMTGMPIEPDLEPVGVETLEFRPNTPLTPGNTYELRLPAGLESRAGAATRNVYSAPFTVIPRPEVVSTNPAAGEEFADVWQGLDITFNAPISPSTVILGESLRLESGDDITIARTDVYTYWSNNNTVLSVSFPRRENRTYTATLTTDIENRYGQPLEQPLAITWKTLRRSPYVYLVSPKVAIYNGYQPETYIYMTVRNVNQVNFELYRLAMPDFLRLAETSYRGWMQGDWASFEPGADNLLAAWQQSTSPDTFENFVYKVDVSQEANNGQPLPPGVYYLKAFATEEDYYPEAQPTEPAETIDRQILIVSRHSLTVKKGDGDVLAWLTDLKSGQPVTGAPLTLVRPEDERLESITSDDGAAVFTYPRPAQNEPDPPALVIAGDPDQPDDHFTIGSSGWDAGIAPYDFDYLYRGGGFRYTDDFVAHVYPDRRIYRPGQTVYFKGIVRLDNDASYAVPPLGSTAWVVIRDAQYREIYNQELPVNDMGTVNGSLVLDSEASLGTYSMELLYGTDPEIRMGGTAAFATFNVAEYRKPEFLVEAGLDQDEYVQGEDITLTVDAEFFFGGPVTNAEVRWTLLADPYYFQYQGEGFYDFTNEPDSRSDMFNPVYGYGFGQQIASGSGATDDEGRFTVAIPADLTGRQTSQTFTFDVAVTGLNNQEVATQARATVHKGYVYVGLRPEQYVGRIGEPNRIELIVVDWDSQPVAGQKVEVVVAEHNWYSIQQLDPEASRLSPDDRFYWRNLVEDRAIYTTTVTTNDQGQAIISFTPDEGGNYKIYARAIDRAGHEIFASVYTWISGYEYVNWGQEDHDRIELVADRELYRTGETATILIPHPYSGTVSALVTLERGHIYDHFVQEFDTNSPQIEIPITADMSPNMFVSVMLVQGMDAATAGPASEPVPSFKLGYAVLHVDQAEKSLNIELAASPAAGAGQAENNIYQPGQRVAFEVKVSDHDGRPIQAELSLALIDKAVLTLAPEPEGLLLDTFWHNRLLSVQTGTGLTLALDRINRALDERKGGGGGDGGMGPESVRQVFADNAFWRADLLTDEQGEARVELTLPDNLTTWVMLAKGVTGDSTLVGESRTEILTSKPLLVRPVIPRFFVVGDEARLGLIVQNQSDETLTVEPQFVAEGLAVQAVGAGANGSVRLQPGQELKLDYDVTVLDASLARLTMGARSEQYSDAIALELPVYRFNTPETVATLGVLEKIDVRLEGIVLPDNFDPNRGNLTVEVAPSLAAGMRAGLNYLEHFPYECTEQTVSRFLPNIFTYRAYQSLELDNPELADRLPRLVGTGLQKLFSQQNIDGGWGWWGTDESDPTLTAYVLLGLVEARRAGFSVENWLFDNVVHYLQQALTAPRDIAEPWQANQQAFVLYALAEAGQSDLGRMVALFEQRQQMDYFGQAFLAMAMHLADPQADQIQTLISGLTDAAVVSATGVYWDENEVDFRAMNTDIRSTAIIITALSRITPDHPLLPQAVRWLMTARDHGGYWSTTQENAWAIIGLTDWLVISGELQAAYVWQVTLNGQVVAQGQADPTNLDETENLRLAVSELLAGEVNRLAVERDTLPGSGMAADAGNLYYAAYLTYYRPAQQVKALDQGIIVSRQYSLQPLQLSAAEAEAANRRTAISEARVGDFIEVRLTLIAPTDLYYVVVEDYLPAGTEALDSSLATTSLVAGRPQLSRVNEQDAWGRAYFTHTELRDEKAVLFADYLPAGVYEYTYTIRAIVPGEFRVIPTQASQMYFPEIFGRSDGGLFRVTE